MAFETDNISGRPLQLHTQLQAIEARLQKPVSPDECGRIFEILDKTSHSVQGLKAQSEKTRNLFAQANIADLNAKIVDLAGRAIDRKVDFEIFQIQEETSHLQEILESDDPSQLSQETQVLERHISALLHDHRLSKENLHVINVAKKTLAQAHRKLEGKEEPDVNHFDWLAAQKPQVQFTQEGLDLMPGEVEELFDIAGLIDSKEFKMAKLRYNQLPEDTKSRVAKHLIHLGAEAFEDPMETIQALMVTAHEIVGHEASYATPEEIRDFFAERAHIIQEERTSGLPTTRSVG